MVSRSAIASGERWPRTPGLGEAQGVVEAAYRARNDGEAPAPVKGRGLGKGTG